MPLSSRTLGIGCAGLILLSTVYCLPAHPSAGRAIVLDAVLHAGLFFLVGAWFGRAGGRSWRVFLCLAALAAVLELLQWRLGRFARVEWADVAANEAGLVLAWWVSGWWRRAAVD
jgi:VanZ family protein